MLNGMIFIDIAYKVKPIPACIESLYQNFASRPMFGRGVNCFTECQQYNPTNIYCMVVLKRSSKIIVTSPEAVLASKIWGAGPSPPRPGYLRQKICDILHCRR